MRVVGIQSLFEIISHFIFIAIAFRALQSVRLDMVLKKDKVFEGQLITVMMAVVIGFSCSSFFISIIENSRNLSYLFSN